MVGVLAAKLHDTDLHEFCCTLEHKNMRGSMQSSIVGRAEFCTIFQACKYLTIYPVGIVQCILENVLDCDCGLQCHTGHSKLASDVLLLDERQHAALAYALFATPQMHKSCATAGCFTSYTLGSCGEVQTQFPGSPPVSRCSHFCCVGTLACSC